MNVLLLDAASIPPFVTVTVPEIAPALANPVAVGKPLNVPPLLTVTAPVPVPLPVVLLICNVPAFTVVPPV